MSSLLRRFLPIALMVAAVVFMLHATAHASPATSSGDRCGSMELGSPPTSSDEAQARFNCFTAALQTCDPVALVVSAHTPDAIVTRTFLTEVGDHGCNIAETVERGKGGGSTTETNLCSDVRKNKDGLVFTACGKDGDVAIPAVASAEAAAAFVKPRT